MQKFFGIFIKKRKKEKTFGSIPYDKFSVQVYRNYEFDSDFENKLENCLNLSEDCYNPQLIHSELSSTSSDVKTLDQASSKKADKLGKKVYVINITNCKYFLVGPQKTINVRKSDKFVEKNWSLPVEIDQWLDCHKKISNESIVAISLHLGNCWEKFGISLGLEKNYLEELKYRNDENTIIITFDMLQNYIDLFPNTSVGFIISILNQIQEMYIIRKISEIEKLHCSFSTTTFE